LEGAEKEEALIALTEHLFPERSQELRPSTEKELKATSILSVPLDDYTVKVSNGEPKDPEEDLSLPVWAGIVPIHQVIGEPRAAKNLNPEIPIPDYINRW
jgi:hypothetical protein